jgi:hypothetical protein
MMSRRGRKVRVEMNRMFHDEIDGEMTETKQGREQRRPNADG